jgi:hypothetical protein
MVKITAREIGRILNRSPNYIYVLLRRHGIKLAQEDLIRIIDLICDYRCRKGEKP